MPSKGKRQIKSYPTPLVTDVLFYEIWDVSREGESQLNYEDPHPDKDKWPYHRIVSFQSVPDQGENVYAVFFAADRKHQDLYNWEHRKANLGGIKFDTVTRSYVYRRGTYDPAAPALGSAMPDVPSGKFDASNFHLIARNQDRISQRGARAEATIGQAELDSVYIVEIRTYIDREEIVKSNYDVSVNGVLYTRQNIYLRGELYNGTPIENADDSASNWGVDSNGQLNTVEQVSDDVWVVTTQDMIPQQGLPADPVQFGGTVLRVYDSSAVYSWPAVLGSDGVVEFTGNNALEIMDWEYKEGGFRNYPRPRYKRNAKRLKTKATIHQEWLTQAQLDTAEGKARNEAGGLNIITDLDPKGIHYPSPYLTVNLPPSLHNATSLTCNTGTNDPTWGLNAGSTRTYPATNAGSDWPTSVVADVDVKPFRGGYLVTKVTITNPTGTSLS